MVGGYEVVIVHLSGGFGNQLFSYAFGFAMAQLRNDSFAIDTAIQDAPWFFRNPDILNLNIEFDKRVSYRIGRTLPERAVLNRIRFKNAVGWTTRVIQEKECNKEISLEYCNAVTKDYKNIYLKGNWGSEKYFENVKKEIRNMYTFQKPLNREVKNLYDEITSNETSVTIHCRRGDYVALGACIKADYFIRAMEYMTQRLRNPRFYCFSEDIEWAKTSFANTPYSICYPEYVSEDKGMDDFRLLSAGKHQIMANSTYSWWAAYLNSNLHKIVVMPQGGICDEKLCVKEWIKFPYETE